MVVFWSSIFIARYIRSRIGILVVCSMYKTRTRIQLPSNWETRRMLFWSRDTFLVSCTCIRTRHPGRFSDPTEALWTVEGTNRILVTKDVNFRVNLSKVCFYVFQVCCCIMYQNHYSVTIIVHIAPIYSIIGKLHFHKSLPTMVKFHCHLTRSRK